MSHFGLSGDHAARDCRGTTPATRISCRRATHALQGPRYLARATTLLMVLAGISSLHAETIYVNADSGDDGWTGLCESYDGDLCGPKKTIGAAMDAAVDGDEVVLAMGVYKGDGNRDLDFAGKSITVRGSDPRDLDVVNATVIDCEGTEDDRHRAFRAVNGETVTFAGFSVHNGVAPPDIKDPFSGKYLPLGGAIVGIDATLTVQSCIFQACEALSGGSLSCRNVTLEVEGSTFDRSQAVDYDLGGNGYSGGGGAIDAYLSAIHIRNSQFSECSATLGGGAISLERSNSSIIASTFVSNVAEWRFGATWGGAVLSANHARCEIDRCRFWKNAAKKQKAKGGALWISGKLTKITKSLSHNRVLW